MNFEVVKVVNMVRRDFVFSRFSKKKTGLFFVVGAQVKNAGRNLEVNSIDTVFALDKGRIHPENIIYRAEKLTPEQQSRHKKVRRKQGRT